MVSLSRAKQDDGIPVLHRSLVESFLIATYCYVGKEKAANEVFRSDYVFNVELSESLGIDPPIWSPGIAPELNTVEPKPKERGERLSVHAVYRRLSEVIGRDQLGIQDEIDYAFKTAWAFDTHVASHATFSSVMGHRGYVGPEFASPGDVRNAVTGEYIRKAGDPLGEEMTLVTQFNMATDIYPSIVRLWSGRRLTFLLAAWSYDRFSRDKTELEALVDQRRGGIAIDYESPQSLE